MSHLLSLSLFFSLHTAINFIVTETVAIKTLDKKKLKDPAQWKRVRQEIKLMERLNHKHIIRFFEAIEDPQRIHLGTRINTHKYIYIYTCLLHLINKYIFHQFTTPDK